MSSFTIYLLTSIALIFVIEGLFYTLFPDAVHRLMQTAINMPQQQLRLFGAIMVMTGTILIWILQRFVS